jgi:hypothetical protein
LVDLRKKREKREKQRNFRMNLIILPITLISSKWSFKFAFSMSETKISTIKLHIGKLNVQFRDVP